MSVVCRAHRRVLMMLCLGVAGPLVKAQATPEALEAMTAQRLQVIRAMQPMLGRKTCPGDPPGNLESIDCRFKKKQRVLQLFSGSVTDQSLLGATFFGAIAQFRDKPEEWHQDWGGFGYRVGSRYTQALSRGLTEYLVGGAMRSDPRLVRYADDPGTSKPDAGRVDRRILHAFLNWATVRRSDIDGEGKRLPNFPLFAGAAASGFVGNAWYPDRLSTPDRARQRATAALSTALGASLYNEFSPDIMRGLGALFRRGRTPKANPKPPGANR